jgi:hypothetical protein
VSSRSGFDAALVARDAEAAGEDVLATVIGQLAGYASVCWDSMEGTGVFHSEEASDAVDSTLSWLQARQVTQLRPGERLLLLVGDGEMAAENRARLSAWMDGGGDRVAVVTDVTGAIIMPAGPDD